MGTFSGKKKIFTGMVPGRDCAPLRCPCIGLQNGQRTAGTEGSGSALPAEEPAWLRPCESCSCVLMKCHDRLQAPAAASAPVAAAASQHEAEVARIAACALMVPCVDLLASF